MFANLYTSFSNQFDAAVGSINTLASQLSAPFLAMATLYVVIWGYLMMTGRIQELLSDTVARVVRVVVIGVLVTNAVTYNSLVGTFFLSTVPCFVMAALGGATCGGNGVESAGPVLVGAADTMFSAAMNSVASAWQNASVLSGEGLMFLAVAAFGLVATVLTSVFVFFEITLVLTILKIVVFVGPLFIALGLFERTSNFLMNWIGRVAHSLIEILLIVVASQVLTGVVQAAAQPNQANGIVAAIGAILAVLIGMGLFIVIPSLAGALSASGGSLTTAMLAASRGTQLFSAAARGAPRVAAWGAGVARGAFARARV